MASDFLSERTMKLIDTPAWRTLQFGSIALASDALAACGGGGSSSDGTILGIVVFGATVTNATI